MSPLHRPRRALAVALLVTGLAVAGPALASTSHDGWPKIDGVLLMNKQDGSRPLDARPGYDPFGGKDRKYKCLGTRPGGACTKRLVKHGNRRVVTDKSGHNKLLGGHGSDTIHAGPWGDVLWGDYKPGGQPTRQHDRITGGAGNDFIYASHGWNTIDGGPGDDKIRAHFGHGIVDCGPGNDVLYISRRAQKVYKVRGCETLSRKTIGR